MYLQIFCYGQDSYNFTPLKTLINESNSTDSLKTSQQNSQFSLEINSISYFNTNLPNFENQNGNYFPKGFGVLNSMLFKFQSDYFKLSVEPIHHIRQQYGIDVPQKESEFSVLNDIPLPEKFDKNRLKNTGVKFNYSGISAGYGNWNRWWGPGIHNSLSFSNNAQGFYHFFVGSDGQQKIWKNTFIYFNYIVSSPMENAFGKDYFLSASFLKIKLKYLEIGLNHNILSGGNNDLLWDQKNAAAVILSRKNIKYWDTITTYYLMADFKNSGLKVFFEIGFPNREFNDKDPSLYYDHSMGNNLGLRKYKAFGVDKLMIGFEYTRLVQGIYYNILPTSNWYDNIKYNYSSYNGRRWAAHSGSDSDDLLLFIGYMDKKINIIYGLNYERHGVSYHFPPEVKLESRISMNYNYNNFQIFVNYENEYFRHYGFVDKNNNVWLEEFELGSVQRTNSILFSIKYIFPI